jgi:HK97 family phage portal protein
MGSLFRVADLRREKRSYVDPLTTLSQQRRYAPSYAGANVTDDTAMQLGAVWGCVDILAELVSTLPIDEYRDVNGAPRATMSKFLADPAGDESGFEVWCRQLMVSELLRGNAYGLITSVGSDGWPLNIEILHPDRVTMSRQLTWGPVQWRLDNQPIQKWPAGPLWHLPAYNTPGSPLGLSPITYAAQTIGIGLAAQKYGAEWFGGGGHPTATLESDQVLDAAQAQALKDRVVDSLNGDPGPLILGAGMKFNPIQVSPEESQFLETSKANADDIARFFFRRPPGEGGSVTYANVEARSLDMLTYSVAPWLVRIERSLTRLRPRPRYVKFNSDALVRVDTTARYAAHSSAIRAGWKSRNDVREIEDLPPIPEGDEYLWPPFATSLDEGTADVNRPS